MAVKQFYHDIDLVNIGQLLNARIHNVTNAQRSDLATNDLDINHKGLHVWDTDDNAPYVWDGTDWVRDALVVDGDIVFRGTVDASTSLDAQADAATGNQYVVGTAGTPSMTGVTFTPSSAVEPGDIILFTSATAATVLQRNLQDAIVDADFASNGLMKTDGSGNYTVVTDNSSDWDTAFSWGDHSTAGYASLTDISVGTDAAASGSGGIAYNNTTGVFTYTPPDLSSYLTAETNDLTQAVVWANVPDANITQSSVTQHQAALSITESQISDLGAYITDITNENLGDLANVTITAAASGDFLRFDGTNWVDSTIQDSDIAQSAVTQHEGALSIAESQITFASSFIELTDISVGTDAAASGSGGITYDDATGVFTYTPPDLSSYLTAETNDLTQAVVWANVPDANITQSSVTQHQAALSIDEDQLTFNTTLETQASTVSGAINEIHGALPKTYFNGTVTLTADTAVTINHELGLSNKDSYVITIADSNGSQVSVDVDSVDTNNLTITSSVALTGIKVAIIGF